MIFVITYKHALSYSKIIFHPFQYWMIASIDQIPAQLWSCTYMFIHLSQEDVVCEVKGFLACRAAS